MNDEVKIANKNALE